jgi:hypothetical protein
MVTPRGRRYARASCAMALRLCIDCGASRADDLALCNECQARPPAWKAAPLTLGGLMDRLWTSAGLLMVVTTCFGALIAVVAGWPVWVPALIRIAVGVMCVIAGPIAAHDLIDELFHRDHVHEEGSRRGEARTLFGRVVTGEGQATRIGDRYRPATRSQDASLVFAGMRSVNPEIARALRLSSQPRAVDVAVLSALLGLAARGRCELVLRVHRSWERPRSGKVLRRSDVNAVLVRRGARGADADGETGWLENALLAALDQLSTSAPEPPGGAALGPYRSGKGAPSAEQASGSLVTVPALLAGLTGRRAEARGWLRGNLRAEARRNPGRQDLAADQARGLGAELGAELRGEPTGPAGALLTQIRAALSDKGTAPGRS